MDLLRVMVWFNAIVYLTIVIAMIIDILRNHSKARSSKCKKNVNQRNEKTTNCPDKGGNENQKPGNPETEMITGANNLNDNKQPIEQARKKEISIVSSEKNSPLNINKIEEKSTIEFDQSNVQTAQIRSHLLENAANAAIERTKVYKLLSKAEMYAIEAQTKAETALERINSAVTALQNGQLADVETEAQNAERSATEAIIAAQTLSADSNSVRPIDIDEFSANITKDSDLASTKSKVEDDATAVKNAIKTIQLKQASAISHKATAEKAKVAVRFLRVALEAARERKNADTFLPKAKMYASEAELKSQAASRGINSAIIALQKGQLADVETEAQNAERSATEAITAAQTLSADSTLVRPIDIDEFSANVTKDSALASIKSKVEDDAIAVKDAIKTIQLIQASVESHKASADKAKAAVLSLRLALKAAYYRNQAAERLSGAQKSAAVSAKNAQQAADFLSDAKQLSDKGNAELASSQVNNAISSAWIANAVAHKFTLKKKGVDFSVSKAHESASQISDEFPDIKAIANKFASEAKVLPITLGSLEESVNTSKLSAQSTLAEARTLSKT